MKKLKIKFVLAVIDFGLWIMSLGPQDDLDRINYNRLVEHWKEWNARLKVMK